MKLTSTSFLSLVVATTAAFRTPAHLEEGVFMVEELPNGTEIHTRLSNPIAEHGKAPSLADQFSTSAIPKRNDHPEVWFSWCGCGIELNHGDCDAAVADLKYQLRGGERSLMGIAYYSIRGGVIAFACPGAGYEGHASEWSITESAEKITSRCGWYIAGTALKEIINYDWNYSLIGYMNTHPNQDFCKDAVASNLKHC